MIFCAEKINLLNAHYFVKQNPVLTFIQLAGSTPRRPKRFLVSRCRTLPIALVLRGLPPNKEHGVIPSPISGLLLRARNLLSEDFARHSTIKVEGGYQTPPCGQSRGFQLRRTEAGSILVARQAGMRQAARETTLMTRSAEKKARGSRGLTR